MASDQRRGLVALLGIALTLALRLLWLGDMEFKKDEIEIWQTIQQVWQGGWNPLAPISAHSGIAHSRGFYYLVGLLSLGTDSPLRMTAAIAVFNGLAIAVPLWFARRSRPIALTFALAASSISLVALSRKLWPPTLVIGWNCLALACMIAGLKDQKDSRRAWFWALGAFCLVAAGHMYLPGVLIAAIGTLSIGAHFLFHREKSQFRAWMGGSLLGWLTFVPYAVLVLRGHPDAFGGNHSDRNFHLATLWPILKTWLTLPTPLLFHLDYTKQSFDFLSSVGRVGVLARTCLISILFSVVFGTVIYLRSTAFHLSQLRESGRDPILFSTLCFLILTPLALFGVRLGNFLHYWVGLMPFAFYWVATAVCSKRLPVFWARLSWAYVGLSVLTTVAFLSWVHEQEGLPGPYGPSYASQLHPSE